MEKVEDFTSTVDIINYLKPVFTSGKIYGLLVEAEKLHATMCKEKGIKIDRFSLSHIEDITEEDIIFVGEDFYGETLKACIPIKYFN